ncbi:MAG: hypothetical protein ABSG13_26595 [Bryobacteraceae bacterium]
MRIRFLSAAFPMLALAPLLFSGQTSGLVGDLTPKPPPAAPVGPAPRTVDGKPDMSGLWQRPYVSDMTRSSKDGTQMGTAELPFTEAGLKAWKSYDAAEGDYTGSCLPFGLLRSMNSPDPIQIMQNPGYVALLYEQNTWFHIIPIGKQHHVGASPTWFGDSVGHWEGDTLVVDTNNFNGRTRLDTIGHPHSDALHVIERFTRTDSKHMNYEVTIDDPKIFTKPWTNKRIFTLRPDWERHPSR